MKRLRRWLFNFAAGVSLLVSILTAAMYVRSYFFSDDLIIRAAPGGWLGYVSSGLGLIAWTDDQNQKRSDTWEFAGDAWTTQRRAAYPVFSSASTWLEKLGFWHIHVNQPPFNFTRWVVPYWLPLALTAILPGWTLWRIYSARRRKSRVGLCAVCGYDLRATPDRCPECGTAATQPTKV